MSTFQSPRSPMSPVRPHSHGEDKKQDQLDEETVQVVAQAGGPNYIQSEYFNLICKAVLNDPENEKLKELQPNLSIPNSDYYTRAVKLVLAYLLRNRMTHTVSCIRHEFKECPKNTGYDKASQVDQHFRELIGISTSRTPSCAPSSVINEQNVNIVPITPKSK